MICPLPRVCVFVSQKKKKKSTMIFHTNKIKSYLIQKYEMNSKNHMGKLISRVL